MKIALIINLLVLLLVSCSPRDASDENFDYDLSGTWDSNIALVYEFKGSGNTYRWEVVDGKGQFAYAIGQIGEVKIINANETYHKWHGEGAGEAWNRITKFDSSHNPIQIEGDNGVIFSKKAN